MNIAVYISSHGFGHLAQIAPVLNHIQRINPDCYFLIRCALPEAEIRSRVCVAFTLDATSVDVGVVQHSAIEEDQAASIQQMHHWIGSFDSRVRYEIELLRCFNADLVVSDISPLAFPAAHALHIPSIGLATLDWHSIYTHWLPPSDPILTTLQHAYQSCDLLLTPPMAMHMPVFPHQQSIGLIAPEPSTIENPVASDPRKKALVLFGGCGNPAYDMHALAAMSDWLFLIPETANHQADNIPKKLPENTPDNTPDHVQSVHFSSSLQPIDLMAYMDVVVCKPGYGVLSECWRSQTPIAWVERPDFPEFPMLKDWLDHSFPAAGMTRADLQTGKWQQALDTARQHPASFPKRYTDGALDAASMILSYISNDRRGTNPTIV